MNAARGAGITRAMLAQSPPVELRLQVESACNGVSGLDWQPLQGGRTNRLWRVGSLVVKLYVHGAHSPLFPNDPQAEAAALRLAAPFDLAPELRLTGSNWLAYTYAEGQPWNGGDPAPVASTLAAVHALPCSEFRQTGSGSAALIAQTFAIASQCQGCLPAPPADPGVAPTVPRVIHGDAVAGNILVTGQKLTLIDWQCPAMGDPAEDLAAFLSPAMQWLYRGAPLSDAQEAAFLAGYRDQETVVRFQKLKPIFRWRMAAHCLWRAERGNAGYAAAIALELG